MDRQSKLSTPTRQASHLGSADFDCCSTTSRVTSALQRAALCRRDCRLSEPSGAQYRPPSPFGHFPHTGAALFDPPAVQLLMSVTVQKQSQAWCCSAFESASSAPRLRHAVCVLSSLCLTAAQRSALVAQGACSLHQSDSPQRQFLKLLGLPAVQLFS